jgi:Cd(II)/Pb(II)-responsive transcriptional regulator
MKIGELAAETGCDVQTVRYYEREGLLPPPARTAGNYRIYGAPHVTRLAFIRHCRSLDMTLDEIRVLLRFKDAPHEDCGEVDSLLDEHIAHVAHRIRELKALERELKLLRSQCGRPSEAKDCGILEELSRSPAHASATSEKQRSKTVHVTGSHGRGRASSAQR